MAHTLRRIPLLILAGWVSLTTASPAEEVLHPEVRHWLAAQTNITSWSASFRQTRHLRTLQHPLESRGRIWFSAPNRFRWEIQSPSETIVVRGADGFKILYPRLQRAEVYSLNGLKGAWKQALSLLEAGFPRSEKELAGQFVVVSQAREGTEFKLKLQPRSNAARKLIQSIWIRFVTGTFDLLSTELELADGSRMINTFSDPVRNPPVPPEIFNPAIPADYKITQPFASP